MGSEMCIRDRYSFNKSRIIVVNHIVFLKKGSLALGLLDGKRLLITGVLTDASLAFAVAERSIAEGAEVVLTGAGRGLSLTRRTAKKLDPQPEVLEFDVTSVEQASDLHNWLKNNWGEVNGALHAIGFAPESCLGEDFMSASWDDVKVAMEISAYSFKTVAEVVSPLMPRGGSIVGLDFDARFAWPAYNLSLIHI